MAAINRRQPRPSRIMIDNNVKSPLHPFRVRIRRPWVDRRLGNRRANDRRSRGRRLGGIIGRKVVVIRQQFPEKAQEKGIAKGIRLGRRKWGNQRVWPEGMERRSYDPSAVTLIGAKGTNLKILKVGDKVTTTRGKLRDTTWWDHDKGTFHNQGDRRVEKRRHSARRTNTRLAKQIEKADKKK